MAAVSKEGGLTWGSESLAAAQLCCPPRVTLSNEGVAKMVFSGGNQEGSESHLEDFLAGGT